jgi:hypothetical protein
MSRPRTRILLFLLAIVCSLSWNFWNIGIMRHLPDAAVKLRNDRTVATADDVSYLKPAEDLLHRLKNEPIEEAPVIRSPGYGIWYFLFRTVADPPFALSLIAMLQVLLFALSVVLLHFTLERYGIPIRIVNFLTIAFAILPTFQGFLFYTLTEGITPAYVLITVCSTALMSISKNVRWQIIGTITWLLLLLTRPILGWAGLPLLLLKDRHEMKWRKWLPWLAPMPLLLWIGVESWKSGHLISPHPVYRPEAINVYRPPHAAFWDLGKSWGLTAVQFHSMMEHAFHTALECGSVDGFAEEFITTAPPSHLSEDQKIEIQKAFDLWQRFTCTTHAAVLESGKYFPARSFAEENEIVQKLDRVKWQYRWDHPIHYALVVPSRVVKQMILHSNLNLYMFQHTYRGLWWMETLRWLSLIIHVILLGSIFIIPWLKIPLPLRIAACFALLYLLYLAFIQRGVEERYTLPVLHLAVLLLPFGWQHIRGRMTISLRSRAE